MAEQVVQYRANDGALFDSEEAADQHNAKLEATEKVEAYIKAAGLEGVAAGVLRKHAPHLLTGTVPPAEAPKPKKAAKKAKAEPAKA